MKLLRNLRYAGIAAGLFASIGVLSARVERARADDQAATGVSQEAVAALAQMNKALMAHQFSFQAHTVRAYVGANGELLHVVHNMKTVVRRPDRLLVDATGDDGASKILYDGKSLVVYRVNQKQYSGTPVSGTIEKMVDVAESRMGIDFPLADLLTDDPEKSILAGVTAGGQVGVATIDGVPCRHFFFIQSPDLDLEVWLEDNERSLPRRVFVTYRSMPGHPTFLAELSDWDFSIHPTDAEFVFHPPAGVSQVMLMRKAGATTAPAK